MSIARSVPPRDHCGSHFTSHEQISTSSVVVDSLGSAKPAKGRLSLPAAGGGRLDTLGNSIHTFSKKTAPEAFSSLASGADLHDLVSAPDTRTPDQVARDEAKARRFTADQNARVGMLQHFSWYHSSLPSVQCCTRTALKQVEVWSDPVTRHVSASGRMTCSNPSSCPIDSWKIQHQRAAALAQDFEQWCAVDDRRALLFSTLTMRHSRDDEADKLAEDLLAAFRGLINSRAVGALRRELAPEGYPKGAPWVRVVEDTYGCHGWHLHIHMVWLVELPCDPDVPADVPATFDERYATVIARYLPRYRRTVTQEWRRQCRNLGRSAYNGAQDMRLAGPAVSDYLQKSYSFASRVAAEEAASIDKAGGRSKDHATTGIWAIGEALAEMTETEYLHRHALDQSITRGGPEMRAWVRSGEAGRLLKIWHTHEQVSTTYRQVSYSRPYPHAAQEMTDQELAEAVPDGAAMILMIPPDTWRRLTARYDLAGFYRAAGDGSSALRSWMDDRGLAYVDPSRMDDEGLADTLAENVYPWQEHMSEEEDRHRAWLESIPEEDRRRHDYEVGCARRLLRARHKASYDRIQEAHPWMGVDTKIEAETRAWRRCTNRRWRSRPEKGDGALRRVLDEAFSYDVLEDGSTRYTPRGMEYVRSVVAAFRFASDDQGGMENGDADQGETGPADRPVARAGKGAQEADQGAGRPAYYQGRKGGHEKPEMGRGEDDSGAQRNGRPGPSESGGGTVPPGASFFIESGAPALRGPGAFKTAPEVTRF